jgi:Immunoglobulin domain
MNFLYLSWYKKAESATSGNRTKITADNQKYELSKFSRVLTIHQPTRSDSGIYVCEAVFSRPGANNGIPVAAEARLVILGKYSSKCVIVVMET